MRFYELVKYVTPKNVPPPIGKDNLLANWEIILVDGKKDTSLKKHFDQIPDPFYQLCREISYLNNQLLTINLKRLIRLLFGEKVIYCQIAFDTSLTLYFSE